MITTQSHNNINIGRYLVYKLEYRYVIVNLGPVPLSNTLRYPDNVPALLFLQSYVRVEHTIVELLHEGKHIDLHLYQQETVTVLYMSLTLQRYCLRCGREYLLPRYNKFHYLSQLIKN